MPKLNFQAIFCKGASPPKVAFHSCSIVQNKLYIFGGIDDKKRVQNGLFSFDPSTREVTEVTCKTSCDDPRKTKFPATRIKEAPTLSHHTANVLEDRYIVFIGGWTGHKRSADAFYFDTAEEMWFKIQAKGDIPVGLSSHTSTLVSESEVIIVGREGGVRLQRRAGDAFYFDVKTGKYKEAQIHVSSRSGHTANLVKSRHLGKNYALFVQGGRKGNEYELIGSWNKKPECEIVMGSDRMSQLLSNWVVCDKPSGRQHCVSVELNDRFLLFFGGETWSGVKDNVTNEVYILDSVEMKWFRPVEAGDIPCLTGHTMGIVGNNLFVFGGMLHGKHTNNLWTMIL